MEKIKLIILFRNKKKSQQKRKKNLKVILFVTVQADATQTEVQTIKRFLILLIIKYQILDLIQILYLHKII